MDLVDSDDECSLAPPIQRARRKRKNIHSDGFQASKARICASPQHCSYSHRATSEGLGDQDASIALVLKLQKEEENAAQRQRADEEYARRLQDDEEDVPVAHSALIASNPAADDDSSLALALKLQAEERNQIAKRQATQEDASLREPDMIAAHICEAVRQLPGNAERPGGSCVNYDCARAFFAKHKELLEASHDHQTAIQIVYHGTPEKGTVFRSIMDGNLKVPKRQGKEAAQRSAYGLGVYTTPEPEAAYIYSQGGPIFMCLALPGRTFFCSDSEQKRGQPNIEGFQSHASPCQQVLVLFESDQILPVFLMKRDHQAKAQDRKSVV